jgi:hypothetical protein
MVKISRKPLLVLPLLLCAAGFSLFAYAYIYSQSNVVEVDMEYNVNLEVVSVVDSQITLKATVTNGVDPVRDGIAVDFYISVNEGPFTDFATLTTDDTGVAQLIYTPEFNGRFDFKAVATIP